MKFINTFKYLFLSMLDKPMRIFVICILVVMVNMIFKGGLFEIINLHQNIKKLTKKRTVLSKDIQDLDMKIVRASDPDFLELEVLNRFDLAQEGDLIFVFSDNEKRSQ